MSNKCQSESKFWCFAKRPTSFLQTCLERLELWRKASFGPCAADNRTNTVTPSDGHFKSHITALSVSVITPPVARLLSNTRGRFLLFHFPPWRSVVSILYQCGLVVWFQRSRSEGLLRSEAMRVFQQDVTAVGLLCGILKAFKPSLTGIRGTGRACVPPLRVWASGTQLGGRSEVVRRGSRCLGWIYNLFGMKRGADPGRWHQRLVQVMIGTIATLNGRSALETKRKLELWTQFLPSNLI